MALIPAKCTQCGANIIIDDTKEVGQCQYCGLSFIIEKTVNNYTINNINIMPQTHQQPLLQTAFPHNIPNNVGVNDGDFFNSLDSGIEYYNRAPIQNHNNFNGTTFTNSPQQLSQYIGDKAVNSNDICKIEQHIKHGDNNSAVRTVRELTGLNLIDAETFVKNFYIIDKSKPHSIKSYQKQSFTTVTKNDKKLATIFVVVCLIFIGIMCAVMSSNFKDEKTKDLNNTETIVKTTQDIYLTEITWAAENNFAFAVEIDDYDGDIVSAGTYRFYPDAVVLSGSKIPTVWDVYVSNNYYNNISELKKEEFVDCIGGLDKYEFNLKLEKGQYVYIKYNKVANNNPTGFLKIKKIDNR